MKCNGWPVAVCSWSLQTDVDGVAAAMRQMAIEHVNLALKPCFREGRDDYLLTEIRFAGALAIEREAGDNRSGDIRLAAARLAEAGHLLESGEHP